jgi:ubiquinone/menaquinone biosynthesis C-methylase UbiE
MTAEPDRWSRWLLERRDAGDERQRSVSLEHLGPIRDRVLSYAEPLDGATLLDVGTGDGLIGLEALDRVGEHGSVIFSDISTALLEQCREAVAARGLLDRARFVSTRAEDLAEIPDASVDVITTRSVLIYVADKTSAFAALHRALCAGGRISLFEPINRLMFPEPADRFWGYDIGAVGDLADKVKATFDKLEDPATTAMTDFDDRDLVRLAEAAGLEHVHLECHIDIDPGSPIRAISLDALLDSAPNPLAPTVRESISSALTAPEQDRFLRHLRRVVDEGDHVHRSAVAYLAARKPD